MPKSKPRPSTSDDRGPPPAKRHNRKNEKLKKKQAFKKGKPKFKLNR